MLEEPVNPDQRKLPVGWVSKYSKSLQTWGYWNTQANPPYHSWVHPCDPQPVNPDTRRLPEGWYSAYDPASERWAYINTMTNPRSHSLLHPLDPRPENPDTRPLPDGWYSAYDPVPNQWLYINTKPTAASPSSHVWVHPDDTPPPNPDWRPLPDGWVSKYDPRGGQWFYVNTAIIPHHWTWDHPSGPFTPPRSPLNRMVHIAKLADFRADHQVSPVLDPDDWLDANAKQVLGILHDFKGNFSDDQHPKDYTQTFGVNTMYPRFTVFIIIQISDQNGSTLQALIQAIAKWAAAEDIERLVSSLSVITSLWEYGKTCVAADHKETCDILVELLDLDVKGICAQLVSVKKRMGDKEFYTQCEMHAQSLLDLLQAILDYRRLDPRIRPWIFPMLTKLAQKSGLYPKSLVVRGVQREGTFPFAGGAYGDVYKGEAEHCKVAIKMLRVYQTTDLKKLFKNFAREVVVWRQLSHPNVLPFYGVYHWDKNPARVCLISPWTENGNIVQFLRRNRDVNRASLVHDIAQGLEFLHMHKPPIIHGDIKGDNILITPAQRACLADFGLSWAVDVRANTGTTSSMAGPGAVRWLAPEILREEEYMSGNTLASDIYALACLAYEIFTGQLPFHGIGDRAVPLEVSRGKRPLRPNNAPGLDDEMWDIIGRCWKQNPMDRLTATQVVERIGSHPSQSQYTAARPWDDSFTSSLKSNLGIYSPAIEEQLTSAGASLPSRHRPSAGAQEL